MRRKLDPYTLRYASACARKCATNARRLQMTVAQESAPFMRCKANALDDLADTLLHKAQSAEALTKTPKSARKRNG